MAILVRLSIYLSLIQNNTIVKNGLKIIGIILTIILLVFLSMYLLINKEDDKVKMINLKKQVGVYTLDITKTELGIYTKEIDMYKNLQISFNSNGTFYMNMKVPFLFDSVGKWNAAGNGLEDWNWLYYESWGYSDYKENTGNQFTSPWTADSSFYINGATPKKGKKGIQMIYFRKIFRP